MSAQATGTTPLNKKSEAAGAASQTPSNLEGTFEESRKGPLTQDRIIIIKKNDAILFVVGDGHGPDGEKYADLACKEATKFLGSINFHTTTPSKVKKMMPGLFHKIHEESRGLASGGTTCTIVIMSFCPKTHRRYILTAHVGDSDAVVVCDNDLTKLTAGDHKPTNILEEERIEKEFQLRCANATVQGLDLHSVSRVSMVYKDLSPVYTIDENGKMVLNTLGRWGRPLPICNVSGEVSGCMRQGNHLLNMTRALGDFSFENAGISQDPTVSIIYLSPDQNAIVVIATDGMWNGIHPTHEQKMASSFPQFLCLKELLDKSNSIDTFGANVLEQILLFFGDKYDDIAIGIQNVPTHADCLALHLDAVPESRAMPSGVHCNVLHYYDCYNLEDYDCDIEEQFPAPVEKVAVPYEEDEVYEILRLKECDHQCYFYPSSFLGYNSIPLDWSSLDMPRLIRRVRFDPFEMFVSELEFYKFPVAARILTIEDVIGPISKAVKHKRHRKNHKELHIRTLLPHKGKYGALHRVNQPLNRGYQSRK
jgi:serine/threonine protein phosphatase PrpC